MCDLGWESQSIHEQDYCLIKKLVKHTQIEGFLLSLAPEIYKLYLVKIIIESPNCTFRQESHNYWYVRFLFQKVDPLLVPSFWFYIHRFLPLVNYRYKFQMPITKTMSKKMSLPCNKDQDNVVFIRLWTHFFTIIYVLTSP